MKKFLISGLLGLLVGCSGGGSGPSLPNLAGVWAPQSGGEFLGGLSGASLRFLQLNPDGTGQVYATQAESNVLACTAVVYAVASQNVVSISTVANGVSYEGVELYTFQRGDTSLTISNKEGVSQTFNKAGAVAANSQCETANVTARLQNIPISNNSWSNLLNDGTNLKLVNDSRNLYTINPITGVLSAPQSIPGPTYAYFVTMQGINDYWGTCACGNVEDIKRHGPPPTFTETTSINTRTDLSNQISVNSGAFDGTSLWLAGYSRSTNGYRLLQVNPATKALVSYFDFKTQLRHIAFVSGQLWGLASLLGSKLVQIDPVSRRATRTITLPTLSSGSYYGLTSMGGKLYVLIRNDDNSSSILVVQP
ncbi:MAG: hypothetical protein SFU83_12380 [Meiothermus sp.]|nr:hypothetical protein [Meiothermus sp.]